jgi:hypothetical protein
VERDEQGAGADNPENQGRDAPMSDRVHDEPDERDPD